MLRADRYPNEQLAAEAGQIARWLEYLAARHPEIVSADPVVLTAIARIAADSSARKLIRTSLGAIDAEIARSQAAPAAAPANGKNGAGYAIK